MSTKNKDPATGLESEERVSKKQKTLGLSTHVSVTAVLSHDLDKVWTALKSLDFKFLGSVDNAEVEGKTGENVGSIHKVTYKDGTVQRLLVVGLSEIRHSITYDMIESIPSLECTSAIYSIRCRHVDNVLAAGSDVGGTFLEWDTDFSNDAGSDVIQDSRFKKIEGIKELNAALSA